MTINQGDMTSTATLETENIDKHADTPSMEGRGPAVRLSAFARRHRWRLIAVWIVLVIVGGVSASSIGRVLTGGGWYVSGSQSQQAASRLGAAELNGRGLTPLTVVVHDDRNRASDPAFAGRVRAAVAAVVSDRALSVSSTYGWTTLSGPAQATFLSRDGSTVVESVGLQLGDTAARRELPAAQKMLDHQFAGQGIKVSLVSSASLWGAVNSLSQVDLVKAELVTLPLIALILLLLYQSLVAVGVSLAVGITSIIITLGVLSPVAHHAELSIFLENTATMLGLGIGVDYSLFIISRFKEELRNGRDPSDAVTVALETSGRTVVFSGITVLLTMSALFIVKLDVIQSIALGAVVVVATSVLVATCLLPVALHLLGPRINNGAVRIGRRRSPEEVDMRHARHQQHWYNAMSIVMRHPVVFGAAAVAALVAVAIPFEQVHTFSPDARILPKSTAVRQGYDLVQQGFGVGATSPVEVVVQSDGKLSQAPYSNQLVTLTDRLARLPQVNQEQSLVQTLDAVSPGHSFQSLAPASLAAMPASARQTVAHYLSADQRTSVIDLWADSRASDKTALQLVANARQVAGSVSDKSFQVVVGGESAEGLDSNNVIQHNLLKVVLLMLAIICVTLLITFRSVLIPIKAVVMNVLSLGATYGILVLVFQKGFGTGLLGFDKTGELQNFVPVLLLALLFSLSTDYEVFLLNRVRERYVATGDNTDAVAYGAAHTARLISGAAILMVVVFGAFAFTGLVPIQQLGFGLAIAVAIDATIVRLVLVPATMRLLGRWNWWLPGQRTPIPHSPKVVH